MVRIKHDRLVDLLKETKDVICFDQPDLVAIVDNGKIKVSGVYHVMPKQQNNRGLGSLANFNIEIELDSKFPEHAPVVHELGDSIPRSGEFHINPDGSCCLEVWEVWLAKNKDKSVQSFFEGPLRNFFLSQLYKREKGTFPFGEHPHGNPGILSGYAEVLECNPDKNTVLYNLRVLSYKPPRGHWDCPCGSGIRIRGCCKKRLLELSDRIDPQLAKQMLKRLNGSV